LLSHILQEPVELIIRPDWEKKNPPANTDYSAISHDELKLIEELSVKMEQLYRTIDHDPS
jgi:hypothetical protein